MTGGPRSSSAAGPPDAADWHSTIASEFDGRYAKSVAFKERLQVLSRLIASHFPPAAKVLDAGCGSGVLSVVAAGMGHHVVGIDGGPEMIRLCLRKKQEHGLANVDFRLLRLEEIGTLGAGRFDCIICSSVLEYFDAFWPTLDALTERLAEGGVLLFSMPNTASLYRIAERCAFKVCGRPEYLKLVRSALPRREIEHGLAARRLHLMEAVYYAPTPFLSRVVRPIGLNWLADNLVVYACRQASS